MTHPIDTERLLAALDASHDAHVPSIVFFLLGIYLESGPSEFDAGAISRRLAGSKLLGHVSPETLIQLQSELERNSVATRAGWARRHGVLAVE